MTPQTHVICFNVRAACTILAIGMAVSGCGHTSPRPPLGRVIGKVTLDGKPLEGAKVTFQHPKLHGSIGMTDVDGKYELIYIRDVKGAAAGSHKVLISTCTNEMAPERVPAQYNINTTLTAEVKTGKNTFGFKLTSR